MGFILVGKSISRWFLTVQQYNVLARSMSTGIFQFFPALSPTLSSAPASILRFISAQFIGAAVGWALHSLLTEEKALEITDDAAEVSSTDAAI